MNAISTSDQSPILSLEVVAYLMTGLSAVLVIAIAYVLWLVCCKKKLGRNYWVGIRTTSFMQSDEAWVRGHQMVWPWVRGGTIWGLGACGVAVVLLLCGAVDAGFWVGSLLPLIVFSVALIAGTVRVSTRLSADG